MSDRLKIYIAVSIALMALCLPFAVRLKVVTEMTALLPNGGVFDNVDAANSFSTLNMMVAMIEFEEPIGEASRVFEAIDKFGGLIQKIDGIKTARFKISEKEKTAIAKFYFERRFHLNKFDPDSLDKSLALTRARMTLPMSDALRQALTADPLGLATSIGNAAQSFQTLAIDIIVNHFVSKDKTRVFLFITPSFDRLDIKLSEIVTMAIYDSYRAIEHGLPIGARLLLTGGPVIAASSAKIMKSDVQTALIATLLGLTLFLSISVKNKQTILLFIPPVALGAIAGMAFTQIVLGEIHALTLGFGIALVGISIDYFIHIVVSASNGKSFADAVADVFPSIGLGFISTAMALGVLSVSEFPIIKEISIMGLAGLFTAFIVSITLCPALGDHYKLGTGFSGSWLSPSGKPSTITTVFFIIATVAFGALASTAHYEGDIKKLNASSQRVEHDLAAITNALRSPGQKRYMVITRADTVEAVLQKCEALNASLDKRSIAHQSPCQALKSAKTQTVNVESFNKLNKEALKSRLVGMGFSPSAFDPFFKSLAKATDGAIAPMTIENLPPGAIADSVKGSIAYGDGEVRLLTFIHSSSVDAVRRAVKGAGPGHVFFHFDDVSKALAKFIGDELPSLLALCTGLIMVTLLIYFRSIKLTLFAILPPAISLMWITGILSLFEYHLNVVALCCVIFQLGLGLDYAIYVIRAEITGTPGVGHMAVRFSAITTTISFIALLTANSPAIYIVGLTICTGVFSAALCSRLLSRLPLALFLLSLLPISCAHTVRPLPAIGHDAHDQFVALIMVEKGDNKKIYNAIFALHRQKFSIVVNKPPGIPYLKIDRAENKKSIDCILPSAACQKTGLLILEAVEKAYYRLAKDEAFTTGVVEQKDGSIVYKPTPLKAGGYWSVTRLKYTRANRVITIQRLKTRTAPKIPPGFKQTR